MVEIIKKYFIVIIGNQLYSFKLECRILRLGRIYVLWVVVDGEVLNFNLFEFFVGYVFYYFFYFINLNGKFV